MTAAAVEIEHVSKRFRVPLDHGGTLQYRFSHPVASSRYRDLLALNDITLTVERGEFLGVTGPNGCGKSTLLKVLSRIYEPDAGRVVVRGRVSPFLELGVGFKAELTARENIFLGGAVLGLTHRQLVDRVGEVLDFAELEAFADQKLRNFSSGMAVRLAFSVAMLADADVLLMDEVLAVGDARFQEKCFDVFGHYKRENRTVVLVSHDLASLESYCDRVVLLQEGRLALEGLPNEVIAEYRRVVGGMAEREYGDGALSYGLSPSRRWGAREVEVTNVRTVDGGGQPRYSFTTGQSLRILVDYKANIELDEFQCAVGIRGETGVMLAAPLTATSRYRLPGTRPGVEGTIAYEIPTLGLLGGSYFLSVGLMDTHLQYAYDHLEDVLEFRVADERGRHGIFELGGSWSNSVVTPEVASSRRDI